MPRFLLAVVECWGFSCFLFWDKLLGPHLPKLFLLLVISLGVYIRLDQFLIQTLIDDEWHAVHQLLYSNPKQIFTSFGDYDYSIPLTLFYWFEAKIFGLSELLMRWPIMLFGLLTLVLFPLMAYKYFSKQEAIIFGFLLSMSPLLISFSRTARPYAITLFLVYFSIWIFYKFYYNSNKRIIYGTLYCITAALAIWLHIIVAFFIIAPFVLEVFKVIFKNGNNKIRKLLPLIYLGLLASLLILLLVLPPLIHDLSALTSKSGNDLPTFDTYVGALFLFFGSYSQLVIIASSILALIGIPRLINKSIIAQNLFLGFILTLMVLMILQPKWFQHSITFSRYLLPIIPVLLLSVANGIYILNKLIFREIEHNFTIILLKTSVLILMFILVIMTSPINDFIAQPNSNARHLKYTYEFREDKNEYSQLLKSQSFSKFWQTLSSKPLDKKIAVTPWYFKSFNWDAPVWEKISKQYIVPGYLSGLCVKKRMGEVPNNSRFNFRNVSYLNNIEDVTKRGIDLIVYQKKARFKSEKSHIGLASCDKELQNLYGQPIYQDKLIKVYETPTRETKN